MSSRDFFFAGGGTGGHIYPAIAVAEKIVKISPEARIHFFCSVRSIDAKILSKTGFEYTTLPAKGFSIRPRELIGFCSSFIESFKIARKIIAGSEKPVVIGVGGFVAAPVCLAGHKLKVPVALLNVDIVPGKANKIVARWADEIFLQFEETGEYFARSKARINVVGCPLRSEFENPDPERVKSELGLDPEKKILLVTGASSGAANVNEAVCLLLEKLSFFSEAWQIVHLTGRANFEEVKKKYSNAKIGHKVLDYFDNMAGLLAAADLLIGRSGAVSVAEYAAGVCPAICMPYPYHKDMHQYLNAGKLVEAGAAVIVDDLANAGERAEWLAEELEELMANDSKREEMRDACKKIANTKASLKIAEILLKINEQ